MTCGQVEEIKSHWNVFSETRPKREKDQRAVYSSALGKSNASLNQRFTSLVLDSMPFHRNCPRNGTVIRNDLETDHEDSQYSEEDSAYFLCLLIGKALANIVFDERKQLLINNKSFMEDDDEEENESFLLPNFQGMIF